TLVNGRLFWIEGLPGIGDFTGNDALPAVLPGFSGRLALDFVPIDAPAGPVSYVFFDGLTVTAVPEPSPALLLAAGLGVVWLRRRQAAGGPASSASWSSRHITLPLPLLGSASAKDTRRGTL
ncbi:MAG: PEP-CTERM sorting domain-containing protein, partial [Rubrivivax sp.]